jgi:CheY-like chemotaxis protein
MSTPLRVALLGFSRIERTTLEALLRIATQRGAAYEVGGQGTAADLIIANADDEQARAAVERAGRPGQTLWVGATVRAGAPAPLPRPIDHDRVLHELARLAQALPAGHASAAASGGSKAEPSAPGAAARLSAAMAPPSSERAPRAEASTSAQVERVLEELAYRTGVLGGEMQPRAMAANVARGTARAAVPLPVQARTSPAPISHPPPPAPRLAASVAASPQASPQASPTAPPPAATAARPSRQEPLLRFEGAPVNTPQGAAARGPVLVVGDGDLTRRTAATMLERLGFQIQRAHSGQEAIERVARSQFEFVFLDVTMEGLDAFQTCKVIKRTEPGPGRHMPAVVMVTSRGGPVDGLRASMAGAEACLSKPLREADLVALIGHHGRAPASGAGRPAASTAL